MADSPMPSALDAAAAIRRGELTSTQLVERCLSRIASANPILNAFVHLDAEGALQRAAFVDAVITAGRGDALGPLAGVPFGVKDLEDCAGMPTTRGSNWFKGQPPVAADDIHVARLRAAGAIPIGKTAVPEFGAFAYTSSPALGTTRNPWNTARTPGGSSGGSTAAVSAGLVPFCTASDGGGSIRTPAAFTGLVGLKPTYGRIPTFGMTHIAQNATTGCVTTTVADTAALLDVMAGPDARDRTCLPPPGISYREASESLDLRGIRIAWTADFGFAVVDPDVQRLCEAAARELVAVLGGTSVARDVHFDDYIRVYGRIEGVDQFVGIDEVLWRERLDELDPLIAPGWASARNATLPKIAAVEVQRRAFVQRLAEQLDGIDLLLTPMIARTAFAAEGPMPEEINGIPGHGGMAVIHGMLANLANLPAISIPVGIAPDGLPVGLQVIGPRYREDLLLAAARRFEQAHPWPRHAPAASSLS
jgi:aspartyl-tRNA(Asn)/glutamyl-tRNA(Gln) amidotransferase subunit A